MPQEKFRQLINILKPYFPSKSSIEPNGNIPIELEISAAVRYFSGGSALDIMQTHGISHSQVFASLGKVVKAINKCPLMKIVFPSDHAEQRRIAAGFQAKNQVGFNNCVGCIDGLHIWIEKPTEKEAHSYKTGSKAFFCGRKGKFGFNLQAVCDCEGKFLAVWLIHPASSSDFISFLCSKLYLKLNTPGFLSDGLVIFGDNAYVSTDYMVTPYKNVRSAQDCLSNFGCGFRPDGFGFRNKHVFDRSYFH
jgi:hypothetical protein